ncbi:hypothetical protein [Hymenobacter sp. YC55]|uniref:hypothetical protein n=1 Tax=Hymenobacter sp. YC55 TaxID=3034019 RepID=UPI0023F78541|nr:hypothetical protein [Hymenobacter sp. YC55]MDF7811820.1 hypothetical protein [Hymenobacter sp. YC55]
MKSFLLPFTTLILLLALVVSPYVYHSKALTDLRNRYYTPPSDFRRLLKRFQQLNAIDQVITAEDAPILPIVYEEKQSGGKHDYRIQFGAKALGLRKSQVVLHNPFSAVSFPLSFSVLYQGNLIALFEPGYFACYQIKGLERNKQLEQQLNTKEFQYHWLLDNQLVGLSGKNYYVFSKAGQWELYKKPVPLKKQPKIFEDERYISCMTCDGEWGGQIYFYDKQKQVYYLAEATCANSIIKKDGKYFVLASHSHMLGFADFQQINDPADLTRWSGKRMPQDRDFESRRRAKISRGRKLFDYLSIEVLSAFTLNAEQVFIVNWNGSTFLATWANNIFSIVDPLFDDGLYAFDPVTTTYGSNLILMNIGLNSESPTESSCILVSGKDLVKVNWTKETISKPSPYLGTLTEADMLLLIKDSADALPSL